MKRFYLLTAIVFIVSISACHKGAGTEPASLVGKWVQDKTLDTVNLAGNITIKQIPKPSPTLYYQFNKEGTGCSIESFTVFEKFNYKLTNNEVYCYNDSLLYTGPTSATNAIWYLSAPSYTERIVTLTSNQLVFYERDTFTVNSEKEVHSYRTYYTLSQ